MYPWKKFQVKGRPPRKYRYLLSKSQRMTRNCLTSARKDVNYINFIALLFLLKFKSSSELWRIKRNGNKKQRDDSELAAGEREARTRTAKRGTKKLICFILFCLEGSTMRCQSAGSEPVWHETKVAGSNALRVSTLMSFPTFQKQRVIFDFINGT